jgi:hypothetical protein
VKAGDAWPVPFEFCRQTRDTFDELSQRYLTGARGCALDHVGEAEAEFEQCSIVFGFQPRDTESAPRRLAQNGAGEARPEAIGPPREVLISP